MPNELLISAVVGYLLAQTLEHFKNSPLVTFLGPDDTRLTQFLTALVSLVISGALVAVHGGALDWAGAGAVAWNALTTWILAEIAYRKTIKPNLSRAVYTQLGSCVDSSFGVPTDSRGI